MIKDSLSVSIIVCTYNGATRISSAIESLLNQTYNGRKYEIIIINNNSNDRTGEICKNIILNNPDRHLSYYFEQMPGLSHARNRGIKESKGKIIAFIDDDAVADTEWVDNIEKSFIDSCIHAIGGKVFPVYEIKRPSWLPEGIDSVLTILDLGNRVIPFNHPHNGPCGTNMAFRKSVFDLVGMFDPSLGRKGKRLVSAEETDLIDRMKQCNVIFHYSPDCVVHHNVPRKRLNKAFIRKRFIFQGYSVAFMDLKYNNIFKIIKNNLISLTSGRQQTMGKKQTHSLFYYEIKGILYLSYISSLIVLSFIKKIKPDSKS